ncbi:MAG TPA: HD domain-containing protein [Solirubrobacterales bacterium]|jgi:(p)ppGpp synthase/HD superfamily hydrolase|nr:HD domain-containing protein [Solirubrobacterales bacterium]
MTEVSLRPEADVTSDQATAALRFARRVHFGQHRKQTGEQFVQHPIAVADLLTQSGFDGPMISAAYLHDVVEKTDVDLAEIQERFGPEVAALVDSLSEDPEVDGYGARKRALRKRVLESGGDSVIIYAADRVANMRDWHKIAPEERPACGQRLGTTFEERLELWQEDVEELHDADPATPFLDQMGSELEALRAESRT